MVKDLKIALQVQELKKILKCEFVLLNKVVKLVRGGSVINGA